VIILDGVVNAWAEKHAASMEPSSLKLPSCVSSLFVMQYCIQRRVRIQDTSYFERIQLAMAGFQGLTQPLVYFDGGSFLDLEGHL
jgi:hypothetical protein